MVTPDRWEMRRTVSMITRDEYVAEKKQQLDEWSVQMDELEVKALKEKKKQIRNRARI
jgi:hypothetical protein